MSYKDNPVLEKLEFNRIRALLADECSSILGKNRAQKCFPSVDKKQIIQWQSETAEIVSMISVGEAIPLGGIRDLHDVLKKLRVHQVLQAEDFIDIERSLYAARNLNQFFASKKSGYNLKYMAEIGESLIPKEELRITINKTIREDGYVLDSASPTLGQIRRNISVMHQTIRKKMDQFVRSSSVVDALQEQIITIRDERLVVPVKVEYKNRIPGIIHDQSASGSTIYVEPTEFVVMNNKIVQLEQEERQEIYEILRTLSNQCANEYQDLRSNMYHLGYIDFTVGKAQLAIKMDAIAPHTLETTDIHLRRAFHPLLQRNRAVPIDITLNGETRMIIITGPNTGGKTVTLKTVGLLVLMHQSGLHIPVYNESELGIFDHVFVDIGDEQSIEQSLSTFSSHLTNICGILNELDEQSLVLYDELGAGTDPGEGASLATAILNYNLNIGCKVLATTHYSELKTYAYQTDYVQNASMTFDAETLRPTYKLVIGVSGASNAFAIAERIGLGHSIIEDAKNILTASQNELIQKVKNLENLQRQLNEREAEYDFERAEIDEEKRIIREKMDELEAYRARVQTEANKESARLLEETKIKIQEMNETLKELRKMDQVHAAVELSNLKKDVDAAIEKAKPKKQVVKREKVDPNAIKVGDEVFLNNYGTIATVVSINMKKKTVEVQAGIMRLSAAMNEISKANHSQRRKQNVSVSTNRKAMTVKAVASEIDLRGMTADEAVRATEHFIDEAYLNNLNQVHIIHGKGTGALRKAIKEQLSKSKYVKTFHFAPANEGGDGATVAILK